MLQMLPVGSPEIEQSSHTEQMKNGKPNMLICSMSADLYRMPIVVSTLEENVVSLSVATSSMRLLSPVMSRFATPKLTADTELPSVNLAQPASTINCPPSVKTVGDCIVILPIVTAGVGSSTVAA